jgi:hypothetical protein
LAEQVGRQKMPVVRTPTIKMPSKLESRFTNARYIVSVGGSNSINFMLHFRRAFGEIASTKFRH